MTTVNVNLPDKLRAFAEKQAAANQLPSVGEYIESLIEREELELALVDGLESGPAIEADEDWLERKRRQIVDRPRTEP